MTEYGYTLFSELNGPAAMLDQASRSEEAGFSFLGMSDHFHPWLSRHTDSPYAWSMLGAVADRTERVELITLVTCPFIRYHPAIVAQAAATVQLISDGRFALGLGAGENLSEHVVGKGWPPVDVRHEMLAESVEIIRRLWEGDYVDYRGRHLVVDDARVFSLPPTPPDIAIAASGPASIGLAVEVADAVVCDSPDPQVSSGFKDARGGGYAVTQIPVAYDPDEREAREAAYHFAFGATGWKVMSELPNVPGFDATAALVRDEDLDDLVAIGPDPAILIDRIRTAVDAGYDRVSLVQVGPDRGDAFFRWWSDEVSPDLPH